MIQGTDAAVLEILATAPELDNFRVFSVLTCDSNFLELIDELRPHVVMLDFRLDGTVFIDICRKIKVRYPHLPVIAELQQQHP